MSANLALLNTVIWAVCALYWWFRCERLPSSPIFLYLAFHFLSFVARPWFIAVLQDEWFLREWVGVWLYPEDHQWVLWQTNLGLIMMMLGAVVGEAAARRKPPMARVHTMESRPIVYVGSVLLVLAVLSYARYGVTPWSGANNFGSTIQTLSTQQGFTSISTSSAYVTNFYVIIVGVFLAFICFLGMRWYYVPPLFLYFLATIFSGFGRTTYLVGGIAVVLAVMGRQGRRWPPRWAMLVALALLLSFISGKQWLQTAAQFGVGAGLEEAVTSASDNLRGEGDVFLNYDMLASVTYLVPRLADHTYGGLYLRPLYFWVPRALWPGKPIFDFAAAYLYANVSTVSFQGLTVTLVGESYIGFGVVGVIVLMFLYGVAFNYAHLRAFSAPPNTVERVFGLALCAAMFQVYRDGIVSLPQYMLYYFGPCLLIWGIARFFGAAHTVLNPLAAGDAPPGPPPLALAPPPARPDMAARVLSRGGAD